MANRVVTVTLSAQVDAYKRGMLEAAQATQTAGTEAEKLAQQKRNFEVLGRTMLVTGGAITAGLGLAVSKFAEFDQAMSNVIATGEDAAENQDALRAAALEAGASTVYSATESANAIEELAKAGLSASQILSGALAGSLDLAAAGGLAVADAAAISATTLQQFQLGGEKASHVADLLAAGAGKAMGDVSDLGGALNQAGLVSNQFGISVEETVGVLSAFASAGMLGSDAGTSMRTMLLRLANPTEEVKDLMAELGIEAYDSSGQFIGLAGLAGELETSLAGMTQEQRDATLAMIFGQDAIRGANILLREGEKGIRDWTAAVDDQGYAAEVAAQRLDNLKGDWEALMGAFDTALISSGEAANGPARFLVQLATEAVDSFNALPAAGQQAVFWIGAVGAAAAIAGGVFFTAVPKIAEFNVALASMPASAQKAARALGTLARVGAVGATIGAAAFGVDALAKSIAEGLLPSADQVENRMRQATSGVDLFAAAMNSEGITNTRQAADLLRNLSSELDAVGEGGFFNGARISGTAVTVSKSIAQLADKDLPAAQSQFRRLAEDADLTDEQMITFIDTNSELRDALTKQATAAGMSADGENLLRIALGDTAKATEHAADKTAELAQEADDAAEDLDTMRDALMNVGGTALSMGEASDQAQSALNKLAEAAKAEGAAIDGTNDASISLRDNMRDVEESHRNAAAAILENGGSMEDATAKYNQGRDAIIELLKSKGLDEEAARQWADANYGSADSVVQALGNVSRAVSQVPDRKVIQLIADTAPAYAAVERFVFDNNGRRINMYVDGYVGRQVNGENVVARANGGIEEYASGGFPTGIYAGRQGAIHKFAEPETVWEAYISGKPDQRSRNVGIWQETGRRLGVDASPQVQAGPVYVQNPFTGEYLLAKTVEVADASAVSATAGFASTFRGGRR